jgi:hypothetical protein
MESVSAAEFLGPLPGWPAASVIAELDGQSLAAMDLSVAERCWRVGAGLRGAILALRRPLFRPMLESVWPDGTPRDVAHLLREVASRRRIVDSTGLIATVSRSLDQRRPLWQREAAVLQIPLSFGGFVNLLGEARRAAQAPVPGATDGRLAEGSSASGVSASSGVARATARTLYRELSQQHRRRVLAAAAALARQGHDEATMLGVLEERLPEWRAAAEAATQAAVG